MSLVIVIYLFIDKKISDKTDYDIVDYIKHFIIISLVSMGGLYFYNQPEDIKEFIKTGPAPF